MAFVLALHVPVGVGLARPAFPPVVGVGSGRVGFFGLCGKQFEFLAHGPSWAWQTY